jgi:glycosyltransferase involved in cell wall biosynthesis
MKIAILTSGILPVPAVQGGAVETLVDFYLDYNNRHQLHDITVYSVPPKIPLWMKIKRKWYSMTHRRGYYHPTIDYFLNEALKDIRHKKYDIIILENRPAYALRLKGVTQARLVCHLHNDFLNSETPQAKEIYKNLWRIITVSDYIKSRVQTINSNDKNCITLHNGIDLEKFKNHGITSSTPKKSLGAGPMTIVFSGRINKEKGIMELIEAMNRLADYSQIKLMVLGSSFYGNANNENEFAQMLKSKAEPSKERITFTGFIPYSDMPNYLKKADVAVISSVWDDPFPTTVLEAQAMGLPIISTRRGGIPEEVTEQNAILLDTDEHFVDNLAAAILDLYQHPEKREQMSKASLERAKLFDKEIYARNFINALEL